MIRTSTADCANCAALWLEIEPDEAATCTDYPNSTRRCDWCDCRIFPHSQSDLCEACWLSTK